LISLHFRALFLTPHIFRSSSPPARGWIAPFPGPFFLFFQLEQLFNFFGHQRPLLSPFFSPFTLNRRLPWRPGSRLPFLSLALFPSHRPGTILFFLYFFEPTPPEDVIYHHLPARCGENHLTDHFLLQTPLSVLYRCFHLYLKIAPPLCVFVFSERVNPFMCFCKA